MVTLAETSSSPPIRGIAVLYLNGSPNFLGRGWELDLAMPANVVGCYTPGHTGVPSSRKGDDMMAIGGTTSASGSIARILGRFIITFTSITSPFAAMMTAAVFALIRASISMSFRMNLEMMFDADARDRKPKCSVNTSAVATASDKTCSYIVLNSFAEGANGKKAKQPTLGHNSFGGYGTRGIASAICRVITLALLINVLITRLLIVTISRLKRTNASWARGGMATTPLLGKTDLKWGLCVSPEAEPSSLRR